MSTAPELESEVRRLSQAGQLREAAEACDRLNQQHPDFLPGWITASDLALRVNEPLISVRAIDQALRLAPGRPELLIRRVDSLARAGESQAAVDTARLLDDLVFESAPAASSFALLLHRLGLHEQARITTWRRWSVTWATGRPQSQRLSGVSSAARVMPMRI
jgi:predicted Zn-dependent protease